jgi:hydroxymethylbilane synthase
MILGTRSNRISMAMANQLVKRMSESFPDESVELKIIAGAGATDGRTTTVNGTGEYEALVEMLRTGNIDAAAVGADEVPLEQGCWTDVTAILPRGHVEDVLVSMMPLERLRPGSVIGISSARQKCLLLNLRPDLCVKDMREEANVSLDIGKGLDGFIVSRAGMELLLIDCPEFGLDPDHFIPAPGQGAVAVLCPNNNRYRKMLANFDDRGARLCVESERFLLRSVADDNSVPVGIWVTTDGGDIRIRAMVMDNDGMTAFRLDRNIELSRLDEGLSAFVKEMKYVWDLVA